MVFENAIDFASIEHTLKKLFLNPLSFEVLMCVSPCSRAMAVIFHMDHIERHNLIYNHNQARVNAKEIP